MSIFQEFHDAWEFMCTWLDDAAVQLENMTVQNKNDPIKIKKEIERHKEFQKELSAKQPMYDSTMKTGKALKDKAPKPDDPVLKQMLTDLKNKWLNVCNLSVEKQRKLEEALLFSGQFKVTIDSVFLFSRSLVYRLHIVHPEGELYHVFQVLPRTLIPGATDSLNHKAVHWKATDPNVHLFYGLVSVKSSIIVPYKYFV